MNTVRIETGGILDLDDVMTVMDDSFDPAFGEAWTAPQCAGLLPMRGVWLSLARRGEEAIGFTLSRIVADEAELLLLAVRRRAQKQGIGQQLLERFVRDASERGARRLHLEMRDSNPAAHLYRNGGFEVVGRRPNYYRGRDGSHHHALTLARLIQSG